MGSGIPVLGAPIKPSHHSDLKPHHSADKIPPPKTETISSRDESISDPKQVIKQEQIKQDRTNKDRAYDRKRHRDRDYESHEKEMGRTRSHHSPHLNQHSSHPTGAPGDSSNRSHDGQHIGYHL